MGVDSTQRGDKARKKRDGAEPDLMMGVLSSLCNGFSLDVCVHVCAYEVEGLAGLFT